MITLTCKQCQTLLEMDDAFAGGVCRCQYCGTIQTVPSRLKHRRSAVPTPTATAHAAAYVPTAAAAVPVETGLEALAQAVSVGGATRVSFPPEPYPAEAPPIDYAAP